MKIKPTGLLRAALATFLALVTVSVVVAVLIAPFIAWMLFGPGVYFGLACMLFLVALLAAITLQ